MLDEPFWARCPVASDFTARRTRQRADQQTLVRVACTRTHLSVAGECLDDRIEALHATERREDRFFQGDDWVEIHLDPGHTHRNKYAFFTNPLDTKADANEGPSGQFNHGGSAEWEHAARETCIKSSLQHRDHGIHNLSLIYGRQPVKRTWWSLALNKVHDGAREGNSIFSKVTYTF